MSRKLVFVNANAETLTIDSSGPIVIVKVDGLGTPETMMQDQKAPFQDGTTYIDALFQPRTITVEVAITKPNNFTDIDTYRRELVRKLNPNLGQGTPTYTTEGGQSYKIAAIPMASPTFPNKDYRDPYARAQVTFYCNDPYWKNISDTTINLPTPTITSAAVVSAASTFPSALLTSGGDIVLAYIRSADNYLVSRTYTGGAWGAESVVNGATSIYSALAQKSTGAIIAIYQRLSDNYLVYREYSGGTWSAETVINAANSKYPSVIFDAQERVSAAYIRNADNYFVWGNWGGVSGAEENINAATTSLTPYATQLANGNLFTIYTRNSDSHTVSREYTTSWSAESDIGSGIYENCVIQKSNGNLLWIYIKTTGAIHSKEYSGGSWGTESASIGTAVLSLDRTRLAVAQKTNGDILLVYTRGSDGYLVSRTYTTSWSAESVIASAKAYNMFLIINSAGNPELSYKRASDGYLVFRTYTTSWSSESVINAATTNQHTISRLDGAAKIVAYKRNSDSYIVTRTYDGSSWGAEEVVNSASSNNPIIIYKQNNDLFLAYMRGSDSYYVSRGPAIVETTINGAATLSGQVIKDGSNYLAVYARSSDGYIVSRLYTTGWSTETVIVSAASSKPSVAFDTSGRLVLIYLNASNHLVYNIYEDGAWGTPTTLVASACDNCYLVAKPGNSIFVVYQRGSDDYLLEIQSGITPVVADVTGDYKSPMSITFNGPSTNPRIIKSETGEYIKLNTILAAGDSFIVNTAFGQKTVTLIQNGVTLNGTAFLDIGSTFFQLDTGENIVYFEDDAVTSSATATMTWTERYVGV